MDGAALGGRCGHRRHGRAARQGDSRDAIETMDAQDLFDQIGLALDVRAPGGNLGRQLAFAPGDIEAEPGQDPGGIRCRNVHAAEARDPRGPAVAMYETPGIDLPWVGTGVGTPFLPATGHLLIFPAWLEHRVERFEGEGERISIAFNASNPG